MHATTALIGVHLIGVALGLGAALMLDARLARRLVGGAVDGADVAIAAHLAAFAKIGLVLLWASGIGLVALAPDGPSAALANPKLQAKLVIVVALTLNALAVEAAALPLVARNRGRRLLAGLTPARRALILACGAVSAASWLAPFALGIAREWNFSVSAEAILAAWLAAIALGAGSLALLASSVGRRGVPARDLVDPPREAGPHRSVSLNSMRRLRA